MMDKEEYLTKIAQTGYYRYLWTTKDNSPMTFEEYRKQREEETFP